MLAAVANAITLASLESTERLVPTEFAAANTLASLESTLVIVSFAANADIKPDTCF